MWGGVKIVGVWKQQNKFIFIPLQCVIAAVYFSGCSTENAGAELFSLLPQTGCSSGVFSGDGQQGSMSLNAAHVPRTGQVLLLHQKTKSCCQELFVHSKKSENPLKGSLRLEDALCSQIWKATSCNFYSPVSPFLKGAVGQMLKRIPLFLSCLLPLTRKVPQWGILKTRCDSRSVAVVVDCRGEHSSTPMSQNSCSCRAVCFGSNKN